MLFTTDQHYPVFATGADSAVDLVMRRAATSDSTGGGREGASPASTEPLENTYWKLIYLAGDVPITMAPQRQEPHFILHPDTKRVTGAGGCNRLVGTYTVAGDSLKFGPAAGTLAACTEGMATEKAFLRALGMVTRWEASGPRLELFDASGSVLARFEARHMK